MTVAQAQEFKDNGNILGSHTITHPYLTKLSEDQIRAELRDSKARLDSTYNQNTVDFVTPYCDFNPTVTRIALEYYKYVRNCNAQYNQFSTFSSANLNSYPIYRNTTVQEFRNAVDTSVANKYWVEFMFHDVSTKTDTDYTIDPAKLDQMFAYLKEKGIAVVTTSQAFDEVSVQK